jgi:hypothetical protein
VDATTQSSVNKKKMKKAGSMDTPLVRAPTTAATTAGGGHGPRGDKHPHQASSSDDSGT